VRAHRLWCCVFSHAWHFTILSGTELLLGRSWPYEARELSTHPARIVGGRSAGTLSRRQHDLGLLDLQRASWVPMLGLDERSVALDIGSGYGAITHSLSHSVRDVYFFEAMPERIEFTHERLRHEGSQMCDSFGLRQPLTLV